MIDAAGAPPPAAAQPPAWTAPACGPRETRAATLVGADPGRHYPTQAVQQGLSGRVVTRFTVGPDGRPADVVIVSETPAGVFGDHARRAVAGFRFSPACLRGAARAASVELPVNFLFGAAEAPDGVTIRPVRVGRTEPSRSGS